MKKEEIEDIYILRKDLRLHHQYIKKSYFFYFWNDENLAKEKRGQFYINYLKNLLVNLKKDIEKKGGKMEIIQGGIIDNINSIIPERFSGDLYIQKQYLPWEREEEEYLLKTFSERLKIIEKDFLLTLPGEVVKDDGTPYLVFTPFYKKWQKVLYSKNYDKSSEKIKFSELEGFFNAKISNYQNDRDYPFKNGTSKVSRYLNVGLLTPLIILNNSFSSTNNLSDRETYIKQLAWREFYYHLYYYFPEALNTSFKKKYEGLFWENNKNYFEKWKKGETGYPFVDAGMRQLIKEGFMHNRLRMVTASFLTKDLLIDWKKGEEFFMQYLIDGDLILNNGGWQWSASTGADPQPYFRIFNPVTQSKRFDLEGNYIKKYIPELRNVEAKYIHEPWKMPIEEQEKKGVIIGKNYPTPIVDHKKQRIKALELYRI